MNGFLIINKPKGITSHDVVAQVRRITGEKKVGHTGTLDPLATGVLVVALGEATKLVEYFLGCDKVYEAVAELGSISDTYDADGVIAQFSKKEPSLRIVEATVKQGFVGNLNQIPPRHSALKINGKRAYELARKGEDFKLHPRQVKIYTLDILRYQWPELALRVFCSKGTYIRSLVHDIGQSLRCGAYLKELVRTRVAHFDLSEAITLEQLEQHVEVRPIKDVVSHLNRMVISDREYERLKDGGIIRNEHGLVLKAPVFAYYNGEVTGILEFPQGGRMLKFHKKLNIF